MDKYLDFVNKLIYLGGNLGIADISYKKKYIDLEKFFVDGTLFLNKEPRVMVTFIHWLRRYGVLLSPSKLRRIIKTNEYDPYLLTIFVSYLEETNIKVQNWKILNPYCKVLTKQERFFRNIPIHSKIYNKHFLKANILAKPIIYDEKKYLKTKEYLLKTVPEIKYRSEGLTQVVADLRAYTDKIKFKSLYEIAKYTYNERTRINQSYKLLNFLGINI